MPTFQGLIDEEGILELVAYIRSLSIPSAAAGTEMLPPPNTMPAPPVTPGSPMPERKARP